VRPGLSLTSAPANGDPGHPLEPARIAEAAGFDDLCPGEPAAMGEERPDRAGPRFPSRPAERFPEPLSTFAAVAMVAHRVRLGTCTRSRRCARPRCRPGARPAAGRHRRSLPGAVGRLASFRSRP